MAVDTAGDAVALWATSGSSAASIQAAILAACGTWSAPVTLGKGVTPNLAVNTAGAILAGWTASPHETTVAAGTVTGGWSAPVTLGPATAYKQAGVHLALAASGQGVALWTGGNGVQAATLSPGGAWTSPGKIAATPAGSFVVEDGGNAVTSPPGQGFGAPVNIAPSSSIMQLTAAAGHALAILAVGGGLSAATEPVT